MQANRATYWQPASGLLQASRCFVPSQSLFCSRQSLQPSVVGAGTVEVRLWLQIHILSRGSMQLVLNECMQRNAVVVYSLPPGTSGTTITFHNKYQSWSNGKCSWKTEQTCSQRIDRHDASSRICTQSICSRRCLRHLTSCADGAHVQAPGSDASAKDLSPALELLMCSCRASGSCEIGERDTGRIGRGATATFIT